MAAREGPPDIEKRVVDHLDYVGAATTKAIAFAIGRDPISVYRCLLRLEKRGQVNPVRSAAARNTNIWIRT